MTRKPDPFFERVFFVLFSGIAWILGWGLAMAARAAFQAFTLEVLGREWMVLAMVAPVVLLLVGSEVMLIRSLVVDGPRIWREWRAERGS